MSSWELSVGQSDEWYTPSYIFEALGETFDLDVAAPHGGPLHVPCAAYLAPSQCGLKTSWGKCFVWMNPPFGGRNSLFPWVEKLLSHDGGGIGLVPDRTSAPWFIPIVTRADAILFTSGKIKFHRQDGSLGKSPGTGTALFAVGTRAVSALHRASPKLGHVVVPSSKCIRLGGSIKSE